ncbi:D-aminopeptidase-like [Mercenaria mercenaria]|uniref:D-aminopeptidase-like n=1 Tax=Mercenaria mercenaria TaxID=6596 RepID=UPI00234F526C|nr:D-aminopeptidase-like [Mercenaria mercenaria]
MKMQTVRAVFYFCLLRCALTEIFDHAFEQDLERFIGKTMECRHIPGLTVSVVKDSETWTRGYGKADLSQGRMVDNTTLFNIGSVTKSFTMVLLGILLTEKGLDWNAKVHDILGPDYEFIDEYRSKEMTLRDMLSHRTGLARLDIGVFSGYPADITREKLSIKMKNLPQQLPFRDAFLYNNYMFMMLGHVAEKLGGDTWEKLVTSKVLRPLEMTSTRILKEPKNVLENGVAKPYIFKDNTFKNATLDIYSLHPCEPAGAILSLLDPGLLLDAFTTTTPTVDRAFLDSYFLTHPEFPVSDTPVGYGHAWFTSAYRGYRRIWHSGGLFSYITHVWMFPDVNAGVYASVNGPALNKLPGYAIRTVLYYISDKLLGKEQWLNETTTCEFPQLWRHKTTNSTPPEPLGKIQNPSEYSGYYGSHYLPGINVSANVGDSSSLLFQTNKFGGILHSTQDKDRFLMDTTSPWEFMTVFLDDNNVTKMINSTFVRNDDGVVQSLELQFEVKVVYSKGVSILNDVVSSQATATYLDKYQLIMWTVLIRIMLGIGTYPLHLPK